MRAGLVVALVLAGCSAGGAVARGPASLELGTGTWRFEPITDGQTVPLVHGAQGGWHFWLAVRATGIDSDAGSLAIEIQPADESMPSATSTVGVHFDPPDAEGGRNYLGWPEIMRDPPCAVGTLFRVRATLTLADGRRISDEHFVVPGPGDSPPPPCGR